MITSAEVANQIVNMEDAEYFSEGDFDLIDKEMMLLQSSFKGISLSAPPEIDIEKRDILPVFLSIGEDSYHQWAVCRPNNFYLVAYEANTGKIFVESQKVPPGKEPGEIYSRMPPEPEEVPPYTDIAAIEKIEIREIVDIPWEAGDYHITAIYFDWPSNTVEVSLVKEGEIPKEGEICDIYPQPASKPGTLPSYELLGETPPLDNNVGVEIRIMTEHVSSNHLPVFGTFNVKARKRFIGSQQITHLGQGGMKNSVQAVVPVTMLLFGLDSAGPIKRYNWGVPVYNMSEVSEGDLLRGYFAIDAGLGGFGLKQPITPGQYVAYFIVDSIVSGAHTFQIK